MEAEEILSELFEANRIEKEKENDKKIEREREFREWTERIRREKIEDRQQEDKDSNR